MLFEPQLDQRFIVNAPWFELMNETLYSFHYVMTINLGLTIIARARQKNKVRNELKKDSTSFVRRKCVGKDSQTLKMNFPWKFSDVSNDKVCSNQTVNISLKRTQNIDIENEFTFFIWSCELIVMTIIYLFLIPNN